MLIATCGHDVTDYPLGWPPVWTQGFHDAGWSYSVLCFPCIQAALSGGCQVQYLDPLGEGRIQLEEVA